MVGAVQGASIAYLNGSGVTDLSDGTVTVDVQGGTPPPFTPLLTWTGTARLRGATEFAPADPASKMAFRLDVANRRLVVAPPTGTMVIFR